MLPAPKNWPRISNALSYRDARAAIDFLCKAFGFEVRLLVPSEDGKVAHSELLYGDGLIMVGDAKAASDPESAYRKSPLDVGGANTQSIMVYVDDADAHCATARANGATIVKEPSVVDYGAEYWSDKGYEAVDLEGHHWWFYQRIRDPKS